MHIPHREWPSVSGVHHIAYCFKAHLCCWDVSVLHSFSWLHNIPWQGHVAICLYIRLFMDVWAVSIVLAKQKVCFHI